jgi:hypothetical protein
MVRWGSKNGPLGCVPLVERPISELRKFCKIFEGIVKRKPFFLKYRSQSAGNPIPSSIGPAEKPFSDDADDQTSQMGALRNPSARGRAYCARSKSFSARYKRNMIQAT